MHRAVKPSFSSSEWSPTCDGIPTINTCFYGLFTAQVTTCLEQIRLRLNLKDEVSVGHTTDCL